jgi:predicted amidohydrolase YtcJ
MKEAENYTGNIFYGGDIVTLDPSLSRPEALAVAGGRILAIGDLAELERLCDSRTRKVDLGGSTLISSFKDHHIHLVNVGMSLNNARRDEALYLDLRGARSAEEIAARVAERAAAAPAGEWIVGKGWNQHDWGTGDLPTHHPLTAAAPENPVFLGRVDAHCAWVNGAALAIAGITTSGPEIYGGAIGRDEDGAPTGILLERAAEPLLERIPACGDEDITSAFQLATQRLAANGVTDVYDAGFLLTAAIVGLGGDFKRYLDLLRALDEADPLPVRVNLMVIAPSPFVDELTTTPAAHTSISPRLRATHVKLYADGAFGSRGAALSHPYSDDPSCRGVLRMSTQEMEFQARRAMQAGLDIATHAIGDAAVARVLDAYERVLKSEPSLSPERFRIEHFGYASEADIQRAATLGILLVAQPNFIVPDAAGVTMEEHRLGAANCDRVYPWRTLSELGALLAGSSDYFNEPGPPLWDFYSACTRKSPEGHPEQGWQPQERLSREDSLRLVTTLFPAGGAAPRGGRLVCGEPADLAILSANPLTCHEDQILGIDVHATLRDGIVTHSSRFLEI